MMRNMILIGLLLAGFQAWGQAEPPTRAIVTYEELMRALQNADETTRMETLNQIQMVIDASQKKEWAIQFFLFKEGNPEPYLPLLDRALPFGSQITWDPKLMTLAVYSSPEGLAEAGQLVLMVDDLAIDKLKREEAEERQRRPLGESEPALLLELLILEGEEVTDPSGPSISEEAREMNLTESDLRFLGRKAWRTYGKGFVNVNEEFDTRISRAFLEGRVDWRGESRVHLDIGIELQAEREGTVIVERIFSTETEVELGQTALLGTTGVERALLLVVRARRERSSDTSHATEVEP